MDRKFSSQQVDVAPLVVHVPRVVVHVPGNEIIPTPHPTAHHTQKSLVSGSAALQVNNPHSQILQEL